MTSNARAWSDDLVTLVVVATETLDHHTDKQLLREVATQQYLKHHHSHP